MPVTYPSLAWLMVAHDCFPCATLALLSKICEKQNRVNRHTVIYGCILPYLQLLSGYITNVLTVCYINNILYTVFHYSCSSQSFAAVICPQASEPVSYCHAG